MAVKTRLQVFRKDAGLTQADLAEAVGISRQAYAAIEAGRAVPSTEVALRLGRRLHTTVEELFRLDDDSNDAVEAELIGADSVPRGTRVQLLQIGSRLLARPLVGEQSESRLLVPADGTVTGVGAAEKTLRVRATAAKSDKGQSLSAVVMLASAPVVVTGSVIGEKSCWRERCSCGQFPARPRRQCLDA